VKLHKLVSVEDIPFLPTQYGSSYRLVYRIFDKPAPKRVEVLSFAEHDPAYERAKARK
jgi:hypothetical protein